MKPLEKIFWVALFLTLLGVGGAAAVAGLGRLATAPYDEALPLALCLGVVCAYVAAWAVVKVYYFMLTSHRQPSSASKITPGSIHEK